MALVDNNTHIEYHHNHLDPLYALNLDHDCRVTEETGRDPHAETP